MKFVLALAAAVLLAGCASAILLDRTVLATSNPYFDEENWSFAGVAPDDAVMDIRFYLKQRNLDVLKKEYNDRTNPKSANWRHWLSIDEITAIVAPARSEVRKVKTWLARNGVSNIQDHGDAIYITTTAEVASRLFRTTIYTFVHQKSGLEVYRHLEEISMPSMFDGFIEYISGISAFPYVGRKFAYFRETLGVDENGLELDEIDGKVVPYVLDQLYNIDYTLVNQLNDLSSAGPIEFQGAGAWKASDLSTFQKENGVPQTPVDNSHIVGPFKSQIPDDEASLDIETIAGLAYNVTTWYWTSDGWMLEFTNQFYNTPVVPYVFSMSWGWTETDQCEITFCVNSEDYVNRCNTEFQKIGLRGITAFASSGDQGAPGDGDPNCLDSKAPISSIYPGASPYVTCVGATMMLPADQVGGPIPDRDNTYNDQPVPPVCDQYTCVDITSNIEVSCMYPEALITSGGGFSAYSNRAQDAPWQNTVVTNYLNTAQGLPPSSDYNANNRGFPDVSALGHNYIIYIGGKWVTVDGTSCSAPAWAGMTALLNSYEITNGQNTTGPINPLLYAAYDYDNTIFYDIIDGNNTCSESACCKYGYPATAGWDAVTGLGTPDFGALLDYIVGGYYNQ